MIKLIVFGCLLMHNQGFISTQKPSKLQSFTWLIGDWQMETKSGFLIESWEMENDSSLIGKSFLLKANGSKLLLENIELVYRMNELFYIPTLENQNNRQPVKFKIMDFDNRHFIAVNSEHDYPKKISYRFIGTDSLHAKIDDGKELPVKFSDYYFTRKN